MENPRVPLNSSTEDAAVYVNAKQFQSISLRVAPPTCGSPPEGSTGRFVKTKSDGNKQPNKSLPSHPPPPPPPATASLFNDSCESRPSFYRMLYTEEVKQRPTASAATAVDATAITITAY
uniref:Uncharacterized protein n=1 Tax=Ananas comosus var. bracteatus TaxID=296719 RepID=A0A6V7PBA1_ANACO|nr:unnamed protein product [Ananas comosus var. bracteatus]